MKFKDLLAADRPAVYEPKPTFIRWLDIVMLTNTLNKNGVRQTEVYYTNPLSYYVYNKQLSETSSVICYTRC